MTATVLGEAGPTPGDTPEPERRPRITARTWDRIGLTVLLLGTAVMYLWNITVNGMGNQFYAAAAQAGSTNWEALLFGSLDPENFITVDKPPVSQWVMGLSGQIFGFSSASMLIPEALMAVATVALLDVASDLDPAVVAGRAVRHPGVRNDLRAGRIRVTGEPPLAGRALSRLPARWWALGPLPEQHAPAGSIRAYSPGSILISQRSSSRRWRLQQCSRRAPRLA